MKILITEPRIYQKEYLDGLKYHDLYFEDIREKNIQDMKNDVEALFIALDTIIDKKNVNHFKDLKYIVTPTTGTDHINDDYCKERQIKIVSLKGEIQFLEKITPTAEHTFGLILSVIRKIPFAFESVKNFEWNREEFVGYELMGKTIGILGFGRLGRIVARYAKAFNMDVIAYDPSIDAVKAMEQQNVRYKDWDTIFKESDIISIHINLTGDTHNIVGKNEFDLMKEEAVLINTSRGQIINEEDLLVALKNKKIRSAALDVLATENLQGHPHTNKLIAYSRQNDNLLITPHIAGSTHESIKSVVEFVIQKFLRIHQEN